MAAPVAAPAQSRKLWYVALVAVALAFAAGALLVPRFFGPGVTEPPPVIRPTPLTAMLGSEQGATFSPEGTQVAFSWSGTKQDNFDIYVQVAGSATQLRLTSDPAADVAPAWSPDGEKIAFLRLLEGSGVIHVITPLGGVERRVAEISRVGSGIWKTRDTLAWSPLFATVSPTTSNFNFNCHIHFSN